jgi:hypothetical protein
VRASVPVAVLLALTACGRDGGSESSAGAGTAGSLPVVDPGDGGQYAPNISPDDFVDGVDHPYLPLRPGAHWVYEGEEDGETERTEVVVTSDRKEVFGVSAVVVRDTVSVDGEVVEDTYDWFAQDREGNVWYLGEASQDYEDGRPAGTAGSWEAGVDGALPGIVMPADPSVGDAYRQEYDVGEAEDMAEVIETDATADVPAGTFDGVLVTEEWNPLEPDVVEEKSYAEGVGLVLEEKVVGGEGRSELIEFTAGS